MIRLLENSIECVPDNFGTQILRKTIDATRDEEIFYLMVGAIMICWSLLSDLLIASYLIRSGVHTLTLVTLFYYNVTWYVTVTP